MRTLDRSLRAPRGKTFLPAAGQAVLLLVLSALLLSGALPAGAVPPPVRGKVTQVVDGDTLRVRLPSGVRMVRLVGIDTPEKSHPEKGKEFYADEATALLSSLAGGKTVRLAPDREDEDRHGRLLRYVYVPGSGGSEILVNREMVRLGAARAYTRFPHSLQADFLRAEGEAREAGRGLWAGGGAPEAAFTLSRGAEPVRLFPAGGGRFLLLLGGMAKGNVPPRAVGEEADRILRLRASRSDADFRREALSLGYTPAPRPVVAGARDGDAGQATPSLPLPSPGAGPSALSPPASPRVGDRAIPWDRAAEHAGERVVVEGTIVATHRSATALHLNFHRNYRRYLSLTVVGKELASFPAGWEKRLEGRKVRARGTVTIYKERPEILLRSPDQVEILP